MTAACPHWRVQVDCATQGYADDIALKHIVKDALDARNKTVNANDLLNDVLALTGV